MANERECISGSVDGGSVESRRYFECRKTVFEMLNDRGYDVVHHSQITPSLQDFRSHFGQHPNPQTLGFCVSHRSNASIKVQVVFAGTDVLRKQSIQVICSQIEDKESLNRLILIVQSKMTSFAQKELETFPFKVEIFRIEDLLVNITKHVLQPKYEVLTDDGKKALLEKYSLEEKQLPYMLQSDAIARYYGLEKGQVVKITYSGTIADSIESYRCVV